MKMKFQINFFLLLAVIASQQVKGSDEILTILNTAKDLTLQELNALRPLFNELQKQYDYISEALASDGDSKNQPWDKEVIPEATVEEYVKLLESSLFKPSDIPKVEYDTQLPTLEELIGNVEVQRNDMTPEQFMELEDMQQIMRETLEEAQMNINELVRRAIFIESELLKLNKPKIVMIVYNGLSVLFRYSARLRRAAYCIYSHVPELNESLENINAGVLCYTYTTQLVLRVQRETVRTVGTIRKNVFNLADVYKKIAAKHSIFGKLLTSVLNLFKILRNISEAVIVSMKALDGLENQLPGAALGAVSCGMDFAEKLPHILETAVNVTTCITFVDPDVKTYEFLLPEAERDLHFYDDKLEDEGDEELFF